VIGNSWGGILGEYALKYKKNLKGLVIGNMMASGKNMEPMPMMC
jgi:proline iminopeptidase